MNNVLKGGLGDRLGAERTSPIRGYALREIVQHFDGRLGEQKSD